MNKYLRLMLLSFSILFLELLLIRFISTEIRIFAYFSNLILLTIFVGTGLGMLIKKKIPLYLTPVSLAVITLILYTGILSSTTQLVSPLSESFIWFQSDFISITSVLLGIFLTLVMLLIILFTFIPLGKALGDILQNTNKPVLLYSLDIIAALGGMWSFYVLSSLKIPPLAGIALIGFLLLFLIEKGSNQIYAAMSTGFILIMLLVSLSPQTYWSPYQKLTLAPLAQEALRPDGYMLKVNSVGYMGLLNLSKDYQSYVKDALKNEKLPEGFSLTFSNQYDLPYILKSGKLSDVLIIGAGGGNDIAAAVRANVNSIDAVEIDPVIINLGKKYHPEKPYSQPNVHIVNDDGRSYIKKADKKYDLVVMGLADSHTLNSSVTNLQLDNYLYTKESFEEIKNILKADGILFISFDVRREWIGGHMQEGLRKAFGFDPYIFSMQDSGLYGWGGVMFVIGKQTETVDNYLLNNPDLTTFIDNRKLEYKRDTKYLTDNWPYLYLEKPRIPLLHIIVSAVFVGILLLFSPFLPRAKLSYDMFFLGTGFLLYEFQNISRTTLLFGNTWITNLLTISSILVLILFANLVYSKWKVKVQIIYILLLLSFIIQLPIPLALLNTLPFLIKATFGMLYLNLPFFFSAVIFITLFAKAENKAAAFASNLMGSALGGLLGFLSYMFGMQFLIILSVVLYLFSYLSYIRSPKVI